MLLRTYENSHNAITMNPFIISKRVIDILLIIITFVILPSSPLHQLIGVNVKVIFVVAIFSLVLLLTLKEVPNRYSQQEVIIGASLAILALCASIFSSSTSQLLLGIVLLLMLLISKPLAKLAFTQKSVNFAVYCTIILLAGAWIGLFYFLMGGGPLLCVANIDGRSNCLYLTTFSNSNILDLTALMRPSGIYDEPGALSFLTILIVCLNELYDGGKAKSFVLLFMGLVTLSLTHILCLVVYSMFICKKQIVLFVLAFSIAVGLVAYAAPKDTLIYMSLFHRFEIADNGRLQGDNRSGQVTDFFSLVDSNISQYGDNVMAKKIGNDTTSVDESSNPFSIWYGYGLLMWIPYVISLVVILSNIVNRSQAVKIASILLTLLLLQRPYIYSMYWGFAIWTVVMAMFLKKAKCGAQRLLRTELAQQIRTGV